MFVTVPMTSFNDGFVFHSSSCMSLLRVWGAVNHINSSFIWNDYFSFNYSMCCAKLGPGAGGVQVMPDLNLWCKWGAHSCQSWPPVLITEHIFSPANVSN